MESKVFKTYILYKYPFKTFSDTCSHSPSSGLQKTFLYMHSVHVQYIYIYIYTRRESIDSHQCAVVTSKNQSIKLMFCSVNMLGWHLRKDIVTWGHWLVYTAPLKRNHKGQHLAFSPIIAARHQSL